MLTLGSSSAAGPHPAPITESPSDGRRWSRQRELEVLDFAVYRAVATTTTPKLDRDMARLSRAADRSKLWLAAAGMLAATGARGRRAGVAGLASVAVTSATVNVLLKPLGGRRRPDPDAYRVALARRVALPASASFPSGHAASAFAFASGVTRVLPAAGLPLQFVAAVVAYSRVHTGVHYPGDVVAGALIGAAIGSNGPAITAWRKR